MLHAFMGGMRSKASSRVVHRGIVDEKIAVLPPCVVALHRQAQHDIFRLLRLFGARIVAEVRRHTIA